MSPAFLILSAAIGLISDPQSTDAADRFLFAVALCDLLLALAFS